MTDRRGSQGEPLFELARAKINLSLIVHGRRADGYHELESLVAFAGEAASDRVELLPGARFGLRLEGANKDALAGDEPGSNLIERAVIAAARTEPGLTSGTFLLEKRLPVAAGIGGGSADAAAALRLLRRASPAVGDGVDWAAVAAGIGADVPVCLESRASWMGGIGERVRPLPELPPVWAIIANPRVQLATAAVFRALCAPPVSEAMTHARGGGPDAPRLASTQALIAHVRDLRNDLERPAKALVPAVAEVLAALGEIDGAQLARMSGSGPTCFALFESEDAAERGAHVLAVSRPHWWVRATRLR